MMIFWKYPINFLFFVGFALFFAHLPSVSLKSPTAKARPTNNFCTISLFQHTAARRRLKIWRTKAALRPRFQHTAARRRLFKQLGAMLQVQMFQHTAARWRLNVVSISRHCTITVSTHSRAKAADYSYLWLSARKYVSTHSRAKAAD